MTVKILFLLCNDILEHFSGNPNQIEKFKQLDACKDKFLGDYKYSKNDWRVCILLTREIHKEGQAGFTNSMPDFSDNFAEKVENDSIQTPVIAISERPTLCTHSLAPMSTLITETFFVCYDACCQAIKHEIISIKDKTR